MPDVNLFWQRCVLGLTDSEAIGRIKMQISKVLKERLQPPPDLTHARVTEYARGPSLWHHMQTLQINVVAPGVSHDNGVPRIQRGSPFNDSIRCKSSQIDLPVLPPTNCWIGTPTDVISTVPRLNLTLTHTRSKP